MEFYIIFQGFEVTPLGSATLQVTKNNTLLVNNVLDSGLDGVMVKVAGRNDYCINFNENPAIANGGVMKISTIGKNSLNQASTIAESFKWRDSISNQVMIGYNMNLMPKTYRLVGKLNGAVVFNINMENPVYPSELPCVAVAGLALAVYNTLKTKHHTVRTDHYDTHGNWTGYSISTWDDPVPYKLQA